MSTPGAPQTDWRLRLWIIQTLIYLGIAAAFLVVELTTSLNGFTGIGVGLFMALLSGVLALVTWRKSRRR